MFVKFSAQNCNVEFRYATFRNYTEFGGQSVLTLDSLDRKNILQKIYIDTTLFIMHILIIDSYIYQRKYSFHYDWGIMEYCLCGREYTNV